MVKLDRSINDRMGEVFLKLEHLNPGGSIKDRSAKKQIERAENKGLLEAGGLVVEASTGNAGVSLAVACRAKGYRCLIVLLEGSPIEFGLLLQTLGAEVRLSPAIGGKDEAAKLAREIAADRPGAWYAGQFDVSDGWVDYQDCGEELVAHALADGRTPDAFVCGVGTGATLIGTSRVLRKAFPEIRIQAVTAEPGDSKAICGLQHSARAGIEHADGVSRVSFSQAAAMRRELARRDGLLVGHSTGAHVVASLELMRELGSGSSIYSLAMDNGERYFSLEASTP
jgi:cysteine synthase A